AAADRLKPSWRVVLRCAHHLPACASGSALPYPTGSLAGRNSGHMKAQAIVPVLRRVPVPVRRAAAPGVDVPAAAPVHPVRAPLGVEVVAPLPDVAVHVVYTESVRFVRAHLGRLADAVVEVG